jgi:two-component sensor histidine kinase
MRPDSGISLRLRLLAYVGLALLPPAGLILFQGIASAQHDAAERREELVATARDAAMPAQNVLASAKQIALALASVPEIRGPSAECNDDLAAALRSLPSFSNISRVDARGRIQCSAVPGGVGIYTGDRLIWRTLDRQSDFVVSAITESRVLRRPIVLGLLPLHDSRGHFEGTINVAIDVRWLDALLKASRLPPGSIIAVFDRDGHMIAASNSNLAGAIFTRAVLGNRTGIQVNSTEDEKHQLWGTATAPLLDNEVFVGFARPAHPFLERVYVRVAIDLALPFLMIALTWLTIWIVMERQLTRWILYLSRIAATYRSGHYALRPTLANAPSELQLLGNALGQMAAAIEDRNRSLRDAVAQKTLLIKEVHHRVKNNLQIIMSLLSLQAGRLKDPAAQETLRQTRARINALALVHRILYEVDDQRRVDIKDLLDQLAEQSREGFGADRFDLHVIIESVARDVPGEMAVPLALFTVEALTNAFKHAFPPERRGTIRIVLEQTDRDMLRLTINDDGVGFDYPDANESIGARLIKTLGEQIGGSAEIYSHVGEGTTVEITFPDPAAKPGAGAAPWRIQRNR